MADMGAHHPGRAEAIQRGTDVARLTGIAVAGVLDLDPAAASCAAANAAGNNSLMLLAAPKTTAKTGVKMARGVAHAVAALTDSPDALPSDGCTRAPMWEAPRVPTHPDTVPKRALSRMSLRALPSKIAWVGILARFKRRL